MPNRHVIAMAARDHRQSRRKLQRLESASHPLRVYLFDDSASGSLTPAISSGEGGALRVRYTRIAIAASNAVITTPIPALHRATALDHLRGPHRNDFSWAARSSGGPGADGGRCFHAGNPLQPGRVSSFSENRIAIALTKSRAASARFPRRF